MRPAQAARAAPRQGARPGAAAGRHALGGLLVLRGRPRARHPLRRGDAAHLRARRGQGRVTRAGHGGPADRARRQLRERQGARPAVGRRAHRHRDRALPARVRDEPRPGRSRHRGEFKADVVGFVRCGWDDRGGASADEFPAVRYRGRRGAAVRGARVPVRGECSRPPSCPW